MSHRAVPEGGYAEIGAGLRVHYHQAGDVDNGAALVFLHGSGPGASGYSNFKGNAPHFASHGYRTLVVDNLGFGYSSKPDDVDYTLDFVTSGVVGLLDALGVERCAVVGNSHGGAVAIQLALDQPDRVTHLVLMAPGGLDVTENYLAMPGIRTMMREFRRGISRDGMRRVFELQLHDPRQLEDQTLDERMEIAALQPPRVLQTLRVPHLSPELHRLQCPVLGWWGMDDKFCPPSGASTLASHAPRARVELLSRCGHWVMVEHATLFNRLTLDFLERS